MHGAVQVGIITHNMTNVETLVTRWGNDTWYAQQHENGATQTRDTCKGFGHSDDGQRERGTRNMGTAATWDEMRDLQNAVYKALAAKKSGATRAPASVTIRLQYDDLGGAVS